MKKTLVTSLLLIAALASVSAQETLKKGDLVYGTLTGSNGPLAGFVVTQRNAFDRIMAQTTTDVNGNFSFRVVNPQNRITIYHRGYQTIDISINKKHIDLEMKEQGPLHGVRVTGPDYFLKGMFAGVEEIIPTPSYPTNEFAWESINTAIGRMYNRTELNAIPGRGLFIPAGDYATYYSIDDFYNDWIFPIKTLY